MYSPAVSDISSSEPEFGLSEESDTTSFSSPHSSSSEEILEHEIFADKSEDEIETDVEWLKRNVTYSEYFVALFFVCCVTA